MEATDELIETNDFEEIQVAVKQATKITSKLSDLISQLEEFKIDNGETHARTVRQWKKDVKSRYSKWLGHKDNLSEALATKDQRSQKESERRKWEQNNNTKRPWRKRDINKNDTVGKRNFRQSWR